MKKFALILITSFFSSMSFAVSADLKLGDLRGLWIYQPSPQCRAQNQVLRISSSGLLLFDTQKRPVADVKKDLLGATDTSEF
jgi:hypothetical protein